MNRYLSFFGDEFFPNGGMDDFLGDYEDLFEAKEAITSKQLKTMLTSSWGHVYDTVNKEIVYKK